MDTSSYNERMVMSRTNLLANLLAIVHSEISSFNGRIFMSRTNLLANLLAIVYSEHLSTNECSCSERIFWRIYLRIFYSDFSYNERDVCSEGHCMPRLMWPHGSSLWRNGGKFLPAAFANSGGAIVGPAVGSARCCEVVSSPVDISSCCAGMSLTSGRRRASPM